MATGVMLMLAPAAHRGLPAPVAVSVAAARELDGPGAPMVSSARTQQRGAPGMAGRDCAAGHACQAVAADSTPLAAGAGLAVAVPSPCPTLAPARAGTAWNPGRAPPDHAARLGVWRN
jgi:hypothetical protein